MPTAVLIDLLALCWMTVFAVIGAQFGISPIAAIYAMTRTRVSTAVAVGALAPATTAASGIWARFAISMTATAAAGIGLPIPAIGIIGPFAVATTAVVRV